MLPEGKVLPKSKLAELSETDRSRVLIQESLALIHEATEGAIEGCSLVEAVTLLISQRNSARTYAETFRAKLKQLGHEYI
jgi:hypothetical protein